jgi:biopolymer transport protein ExbB
MNANNPITYFFAHTDALGSVLFCLLLLMSLLSWFGILSKAFALWQALRAGQASRQRFWQEPASADSGSPDPFARLAHAAFAVHRDLRADATPGSEDLLLRCMNRVVGEEANRLDSGQTLLATVAGVAPFIGLFGTVWGVHHALLSIGSNGSASIEQIAGPVGEALIMTALGLAVAIPALLGYNLFARNSQRLLGELDSFAHDVHHYLVTGRPLPATMRAGQEV